MAERGEISKQTNGKYYKTRKTIFGELAPSPSRIANEYLVKNGRIIVYMTGGSAFTLYLRIYCQPKRTGEFMNLHEDKKLFADAVLATAQYLDINPIFVEKNYWITRSLKMLVAADDDNRTVKSCL